MIEFPSKEEALKGGTFKASILRPDDYLARIVEIEANHRKQTYDSFLTKGNQDISTLPENEIETVVKVVMLVYGVKGGGDIVNTDGEIIESLTQRLYADLPPYIGFNQQTGQPTKYRAFFAHAMKTDPYQPFSAPGVGALVGKYVGVELGLSKTGKNKILGFKKIPDNFTPDTALEEAAMQKYYEQREKALMNKTGDKPF